MSEIANYFIYAIPVFGIALVFMSKTGGVEAFKFSQTGIWLSLLLYMGPPPGAGGPPPPDWQAHAKAAMDQATAAYLAGDSAAETRPPSRR